MWGGIESAGLASKALFSVTTVHPACPHSVHFMQASYRSSIILRIILAFQVPEMAQRLFSKTFCKQLPQKIAFQQVCWQYLKVDFFYFSKLGLADAFMSLALCNWKNRFLSSGLIYPHSAIPEIGSFTLTVLLKYLRT